jgi:hypothetical protein
VLVIEPNRMAGLEMLGLSLLSIACSAAGLGLANRFSRLHGDPVTHPPVTGAGK